MNDIDNARNVGGKARELVQSCFGVGDDEGRTIDLG